MIVHCLSGVFHRQRSTTSPLEYDPSQPEIDFQASDVFATSSQTSIPKNVGTTCSPFLPDRTYPCSAKVRERRSGICWYHSLRAGSTLAVLLHISRSPLRLLHRLLDFRVPILWPTFDIPPLLSSPPFLSHAWDQQTRRSCQRSLITPQKWWHTSRVLWQYILCNRNQCSLQWRTYLFLKLRSSIVNSANATQEIFCIVEGGLNQAHPFRRVRDATAGNEHFTITHSPWTNRLVLTSIPLFLSSIIRFQRSACTSPTAALSRQLR